MAKEKTDDRVTKRRVTCRMVQAAPEPGMPDLEWTKVDYVPDDDRDVLNAYVAAHRADGWQVSVSAEFDAGPGGYHGQTAIPEFLDHPLAGTVYAETKED